MKKLVIFDLDGTLLNTIADLAHSTNHALRQNGFPTHDVKEYNFFVGNGINKLFERALPEGEKTEENILKVREEFLKHYDLHNTDRSAHFFPSIQFTEVLGQREGVKAKPDPSIVNEIVERASISKENALYVGDSDVDMQTAINSEVTSCGVTWGFRPRTELEKYAPDHIAEKAEDILKFI